MQIDLTDHRGIIFKLLRKAKFPVDEQEDGFQEFCVFFYTDTGSYSEEYAVSTFVEMRFRNWLTVRAQYFNRKKRRHSTVEIEAQNPDFLDYQQAEMEVSEHRDLTSIENEVLCSELLKDMSSLTKAYLIEQSEGKNIRQEEGIVGRTAAAQGISRQAVEKKIKRELKALR